MSVVAIASELAAGALESFVAQPKFAFLGEDCSRLIAHKLLTTLAACHERGVFHRDIKPEVSTFAQPDCLEYRKYLMLQNILVDGSTFDIKLSDFGLAHMSDTSSASHMLCTQPCGTRGFKAPEVTALGEAVKEARNSPSAREALRTASFSALAYDASKVDAWSATVAIFVLAAGHAPLGRAAPGDWFFDVISCAARCHDSLPAVPVWDKFWAAHQQWGAYSPAFKSFIQAGMCVDPAQRATIQQLLQHPWLEGISGSANRRVLTAELARRAQAMGYSPAQPMQFKAFPQQVNVANDNVTPLPPSSQSWSSEDGDVVLSAGGCPCAGVARASGGALR
jgi:serine/threonine protein kinase